MKKFLFSALFFSMSVVFASDGILDSAMKENQNAKKHYEEISSLHSLKVLELQKKIESLRLKSENLYKAIEAEKSKLADISSLDKKLDYHSKLAAKVSTEAASISSSSKQPLLPTIPEATAYARKTFESSISELIYGDTPKEVSANVSVGNVVKGVSFRIGATSYFVSDKVSGFFLEDGRIYGKRFSEDIAKFHKENLKKIPFDVTGGSLADTEAVEFSFSRDFSKGGIWLYPILFFGLLSFVVCVLKIGLFAKIGKIPNDVIQRVFSVLEQNGEDSAYKVIEKYGYPYSQFLRELLMSRKMSASMLEEISYEYMLVAGEKLFGKLSVLSVTAAVAPLFGLLGTVTGIIKTFGDLSVRGAEHARLISSGISEALITTEYGLIVAIPAFVAHALFSRKAKTVLANMEKLAAGFISRNSESNK